MFRVVARVMSGSVFCQLIIGILFISTTTFEMELVRHQRNALLIMEEQLLLFLFVVQALKSLDYHILLLLLCSFLSIGCVFLFCAVGSYTTDTFSRFAVIPYESLWYKCPIKLQKYFFLIIADGQRPQVFRGMSIVDLDLMAFSKVKYFGGTLKALNRTLKFSLVILR